MRRADLSCSGAVRDPELVQRAAAVVFAWLMGGVRRGDVYLNRWRSCCSMHGSVSREESCSHRPWMIIWTRLQMLSAVTSQPSLAATSSIAWQHESGGFLTKAFRHRFNERWKSIVHIDEIKIEKGVVRQKMLPHFLPSLLELTSHRSHSDIVATCLKDVGECWLFLLQHNAKWHSQPRCSRGRFPGVT